MNISTLQGLVNTLSTHIDNKDVANDAISKANVGWHIQHSFIVIAKIIEATKQSNPSNYKWKFNFKRTLIYSLKKIPRGKARAPKTVMPVELANAQTLHQLKEQALQAISILNTLDKKNYFSHPFFGNLKLSHTIKTLNIHTKHHLNIITDILAHKN
ncbi:MAG: DinB family protein [Ferruginibacter sp.]|nr:DinB family protein [Ferruginibacter sp.]